MPKKISQYLTQSENQLIAMKNCKINIDLSIYDKKDEFEVDFENNEIWFKSTICQIEFEDTIFNIILDYPIKFNVYDFEQIGKNIIILKYTPDSIILNVELEADLLQEQIAFVKRLLGGKEIFKNVNHLFLKLFKIYGPLTNTDLIHLEILLSQCLRNKSNLQLPARLGKKWDPAMINIKQIVFATSFLQGLAFEQIGEALKTGLISDTPSEKSILEKVLTGELVQERT